jgi:hypothetical protein
MSTLVNGTVHALLWESSEACASRRLKAVAALTAVTEVLRAQAPLDGGEREFLQLIAGLEAEAPATARSMWVTPQAYVWVRRAYELVRAALQEHGADAPTGRSAREVLAAHLDAFHRFALAAAARGGFDLAFERPWKTSLPLDLPRHLFYSVPLFVCTASIAFTGVYLVLAELALALTGRPVDAQLALIERERAALAADAEADAIAARLVAGAHNAGTPEAATGGGAR